MKHVVTTGYTDIRLNKHLDKGAVLEEEYTKEGKELTEERIKYLMEERKLCKEETDEGEETADNTEETDEGEETTDNTEETDEGEEATNKKKKTTSKENKKTSKK